MKSNKGITLISLIIYIAVLTIVVAMLSLVTNLFYSNIDYITENSEYVSEYNKFNACFIEDVKNNKKVLEITNDKIIFEDGTIYTYTGEEENAIYRNKVKICEKIYYCKFSKTEETVENTKKQIVHVKMLIKSSKVFETDNDYVLRYW